jgi:hypothetical protein
MAIITTCVVLYILMACAVSGYFSRHHNAATPYDDKAGAYVSGGFWIITLPIYILYKAGAWCYNTAQGFGKKDQ